MWCNIGSCAAAPVVVMPIPIVAIGLRIGLWWWCLAIVAITSAVGGLLLLRWWWLHVAIAGWTRGRLLAVMMMRRRWWIIEAIRRTGRTRVLKREYMMSGRSKKERRWNLPHSPKELCLRCHCYHHFAPVAYSFWVWVVAPAWRVHCHCCSAFRCHSSGPGHCSHSAEELLHVAQSSVALYNPLALRSYSDWWIVDSNGFGIVDSVIYNCVMGGSGFGCVRLSFVFGDKQLMMASTIHKQKREKSWCNYKDMCGRNMINIHSA